MPKMPLWNLFTMLNPKFSERYFAVAIRDMFARACKQSYSNPSINAIME